MKIFAYKYVGQKRFSLEGGEALIPALDALIEKAASDGIKEFVVGMAQERKTKYTYKYFGKPVEDILMNLTEKIMKKGF